MPQIQERLKVLSETAVIAGEESGLAAKNFFSTMARWQKVVFFGSLVLIIPVYFGAYYVSRAITKSNYEKHLLQAHPAFGQAKPIGVTPVAILKVTQGQYAAYFQVTNNNLDLVSPDVPYSIDFFNTAGEKIYTSQGSFFLLADQKKYILVPRVDSREEIATAKLNITEVQWQKRLSATKVEFKTPQPELYDQTTIEPSQLVAEGSVINDSPYTIKKIKITFLLFNRSGQVVGISVRDEGNLIAFGRRAYKQSWPNLNADSISRVEVSVDVNTLDQTNILFTTSSAVPVSEIPELN